METITKYKAYDGTEFGDAATCGAYEINCLAADNIISQLDPRPKDDGCEFANGYGYIKHPPAKFKKVRKELLMQAGKECSHRWFNETMDKESVHPSWADRIISEGCTKRLGDAWFRVMCTDSSFREWGQPYYANHPEAAPRKHRINK